MKIRHCPYCGYKYSYSEYLRKLLFSTPGASWQCTHCGSQLTFNSGRRLLVSIICFIPIIISPLIINLFREAGLTEGLSWITFVLFYVIWSLMIYSFDTFMLTRKEEK